MNKKTTSYFALFAYFVPKWNSQENELENLR